MLLGRTRCKDFWGTGSTDTHLCAQLKTLRVWVTAPHEKRLVHTKESEGCLLTFPFLLPDYKICPFNPELNTGHVRTLKAALSTETLLNK